MLSTVDWEDEVTTRSLTEYFSTGKNAPISAARGSRVSNATIAFNIVLGVIGVLGISTNGMVLAGIKMTSS